MSITRLSFSTSMAFGPGARKRVAAHLREAGRTRLPIVTDRALAALPMPAEFRSPLARLEAGLLDGVFGNPTASQVMADAAACKVHCADSRHQINPRPCTAVDFERLFRAAM